MSACMNCGAPGLAGDGFCVPCSNAEQERMYAEEQYRLAEEARQADLDRAEREYVESLEAER